MLGEIDKQMMLKFLERNYPVSRIKSNLRFKRGIILEDGSEWFLSEKSQLLPLENRLVSVLIKVFDCDVDTSRVVLNSFLRLR